MAYRVCLALLARLVIRDQWAAMVPMENLENQAQEDHRGAMVKQACKV